MFFESCTVPIGPCQSTGRPSEMADRNIASLPWKWSTPFPLSVPWTARARVVRGVWEEYWEGVTGVWRAVPNFKCYPMLCSMIFDLGNTCRIQCQVAYICSFYTLGCIPSIDSMNQTTNGHLWRSWRQFFSAKTLWFSRITGPGSISPTTIQHCSSWE